MQRPLELSPSARWWPSTLWQTTTFEVRRNGVRLLVDPGVAPWEVRQAAGDGVEHVLITHADWDHVMGIGLLSEATVYAGALSAARIASGEAAAAVRREAGGYYVPVEGLDELRVDDVIEPPAEGSIGPWAATFSAAPGHTEDGMATWLPEERLLVVGDHLSPLEIPFVFHSAWDYRETLETLSDLISRERPERVVIGHGAPLDAETALRIAEEDRSYVEALIAHADGGGDPEAPDGVAPPVRVGGSDEHAGNVRRTCELARAR